MKDDEERFKSHGAFVAEGASTVIVFSFYRALCTPCVSKSLDIWSINV